MKVFDEYGYNYINLNKQQTSALSEAILSLPHEGLCTILGIYCFHFNKALMSKLYGIENSDLENYFYMNLLCYKIGLSNGEMISDLSAKRASQLAIKKYLDIEFYNGSYSKRRIVRNVLIAALIAVMGFITVVASCPPTPKNPFSWYVVKERDDVLFELKSDIEVAPLEPGMCCPTYIPEGFELVNTVEQPTLLSYEYDNGLGDNFYICVSMPNQRIYLSGEDSDILNISVNGKDAFYFVQSSENDSDCRYIVFEKNGYAIDIISNLSQEELVKIAESI